MNKVSGFHGAVSCIIEHVRIEKLVKKKFFFILLEGLPVPFAIEELTRKGDELIVKFEGVDSEQQAKRIVRNDLYSEKQRVTKGDEFLSWKDLTGYLAVDARYGNIGKIEEVLEFPMQMIAKCMLKGKEVLIPLNDDIVVELNENEKKIIVELPDGFLDIYLA